MKQPQQCTGFLQKGSVLQSTLQCRWAGSLTNKNCSTWPET